MCEEKFPVAGNAADVDEQVKSQESVDAATQTAETQAVAEDVTVVAEVTESADAPETVATAEVPASETEKAPAEKVGEQEAAGAESGQASEPADADAKAEADADAKAETEEPTIIEQVVNYAEMTLAELSGLFEKLADSVDRMKRSKEADAIKSAFYKRLSKEKVQAGLSAPEVPSEDEETQNAGTVAPETVETPKEEGKESPFAALEDGFKTLYNKYRAERAEFNRQLEKEREENLTKKQTIIEELKNLVENQEDMSAAFPQFRELQNRWKAAGQVPQANFREVNDSYQHWVEQFYDKVQINRELRDIDFKKNLEAKEAFCEAAEKLSENEDVVAAFKELQKLHEQWKEFGPVAKEFRDSIWDRFKVATAIINKKYQGYFEDRSKQQAENLVAKQGLCEKVEAIAAKEDIKSSSEWNALSKEIEAIQAEWKKIGFASKKENQKIYDRFRAACDKFFERKRVYYNEFKESMNGNMEKKLALIAEAEALKASTDWKKTTDKFISLQKQWKEAGSVPRKKSEQLWKRFRAACDAFFEERDKQAKPENDYFGNLRAKKAIIEEIKTYELSDDASDNNAAARQFSERFNAIGFVPYKEKETIVENFRNALKAKFPDYREASRPRGQQPRRGNVRDAQPKTEKDRLVAKYNHLQQEIDTYENNIGFFAASKNSAPLIQQTQERINSAKAELKELETKILALSNEEKNSGE